MTALVAVDGLSLAFGSQGNWTRVLHDVSFTIAPGEVMGLVGESGCGKSTIGLTLLGYRASNARIESGRVLFKGQDLLEPRASSTRQDTRQSYWLCPTKSDDRP